MLKPTNNNEKCQSESITFRIGKPFLNELRLEAQNKLKSINTLVNQVINTYVVVVLPHMVDKTMYQHG